MTYLTSPKGPGARGFSKQFWDDNYDEPDTMDGIYNAREQARYIKAVLDSEYVHVGSVVALGFGLGYLFKEVLAEFVPHTAVGIEPSAHAFHRARRLGLSPAESTELMLSQIDIATWCEQPTPVEVFELGLCSSVFQYMSDPEIKAALPVMARRIKYLYFSVPTDLELAYQAKHLGLDDKYAYARTREEYLELLRGHFTIVSRRLLESNVHFDAHNSGFNDLLFRF